MTVQTLYRLCVWLPLIVPAVVAGLVHGLGYAVHVRPLKQVVQVLLGSLIYGGIPYAALAVWATWWIGGKGQAQIERQMLRAPLIMVAVFVVFAAVLGFVAGQPRLGLGLSLLGAVVIIPLGYGYVAVVVLLQRGFESQLRPGTPSR